MSRRNIPNRFGGRVHADLMAPSTAALIAFRLGTADSQHYHDLAVSLSVAYRMAEAVPRHRHLLEHLRLALNALNAVFERRPDSDAPWSATPAEIDEIENGTKIYASLLVTTPGNVLVRAIQRVNDDSRTAPQP